MVQKVIWNKEMINLTEGDMDISYQTAPLATLRMMQLCYPYMKANGGGSIISLAPEAGTAGLPLHGAYAAAKEAIRGLTKVGAIDTGRDNIRVNVICPMSGAPHESSHPLMKGAIERSNLNRIGDPETDIGSVIVFLAGPGKFITGRTLHVDGGAGTWR